MLLEKKTIINYGLHIQVIKATRRIKACALLVVIPTLFYIILN